MEGHNMLKIRPYPITATILRDSSKRKCADGISRAIHLSRKPNLQLWSTGL